ncbi:hypothetical protein BG844_37850 [Couchioplanes caeruleus subsp. caeruleus]|uniref:Uncharacterized protein n=1 Tax=Couchioplanes caeruleus subsp. caeruleus TaxID=56427 RepID=A0A1K0F960_9ACTN|nr:hypothetical protein BG844_37850 [Couchioplanes caeruleus subsp. caeruleus]
MLLVHHLAAHFVGEGVHSCQFCLGYCLRFADRVLQGFALGRCEAGQELVFGGSRCGIWSARWVQGIDCLRW